MDTALFSAGNLFAGDDSDDSTDSVGDGAFVERDHEFPGMILKIREFSFHQVNANLLWPGTRIFAEWLVKHPTILSERRILELGSGTGALTIFLRKMYDLDITTSDYDDGDIEKNIHHNHVANGVAAPPHIRHTWGDRFPSEGPDWDLIIASDILLCEFTDLLKCVYSIVVSTLFDTLTERREHTVCRDCRDHLSTAADLYHVYDRHGCNVALLPYATRTCPFEFLCLADVKQYPNLVKTLVFLLQTWKPKKISVKDQPSDSNSITDGDLQAGDLGSNSREETQIGKRNNVVTVPLSLPKPCFLMSWRRRIPKEDEDLFSQGCKAAGLCVADYGARVYCIYPNQRVE